MICVHEAPDKYLHCPWRRWKGHKLDNVVAHAVRSGCARGRAGLRCEAGSVMPLGAVPDCFVLQIWRIRPPSPEGLPEADGIGPTSFLLFGSFRFWDDGHTPV